MKITVYHGMDSDQALDRVRQRTRGSVFLKTPPNGWYLVAEFLAFFQKIQEETKAGERSPIYIYDFFDHIDEAIDIDGTVVALAALERPVFTAVCSSYPKEKLQNKHIQVIERW